MRFLVSDVRKPWCDMPTPVYDPAWSEAQAGNTDPPLAENLRTINIGLGGNIGKKLLI